MELVPEDHVPMIIPQLATSKICSANMSIVDRVSLGRISDRRPIHRHFLH